MPDYQFSPENADYIEVVADAVFDGELTSSEILKILEVIQSLVHSSKGESIFLEGLKSIAIDKTMISLGLLFRRKGIEILTSQGRDELPRNMSRFLMHCFANIDKIHVLSETPFPPNFRSFIDASTWEVS
jgi:hypothetical protein